MVQLPVFGQPCFAPSLRSEVDKMQFNHRVFGKVLLGGEINLSTELNSRKCRIHVFYVQIIQIGEFMMGFFSSMFGSGSSSSSSSSSSSNSSDECKCHNTSSGTRITKCSGGSKSFSSTRDTSKGSRTTTYNYGKKK